MGAGWKVCGGNSVRFVGNGAVSAVGFRERGRRGPEQRSLAQVLNYRGRGLARVCDAGAGDAVANVPSPSRNRRATLASASPRMHGGLQARGRTRRETESAKEEREPFLVVPALLGTKRASLPRAAETSLKSQGQV
eukprot:3972069-Pyramimonas_sp.AAC.1